MCSIRLAPITSKCQVDDSSLSCNTYLYIYNGDYVLNKMIVNRCIYTLCVWTGPSYMDRHNHGSATLIRRPWDPLKPGDGRTAALLVVERSRCRGGGGGPRELPFLAPHVWNPVAHISHAHTHTYHAYYTIQGANEQFNLARSIFGLVTINKYFWDIRPHQSNNNSNIAEYYQGWRRWRRWRRWYGGIM